MRKYLVLQQNPQIAEPQKLGLFNANTWAVYLLKGEAFVKTTKADIHKTYPDFGCSFETFTNDTFLEIETLGPMSQVAPEGVVEQVEHWSLHRNIKLSSISEQEIDRIVLPLLQAEVSH